MLETTASLEQSALHSYLVSKFTSWSPSAPDVVERRRGDITLDWSQKQFTFLQHQLIYRLEKNNKLPKWIVVYSGGKTTKRIDDLAPQHPHRFRMKVILKAEAVPHLVELALKHYGDENTVYEQIENFCRELEDNVIKNDIKSLNSPRDNLKDSRDSNSERDFNAVIESGQVKMDNIKQVVEAIKLAELKKKMDSDRIDRCEHPRWLESQWSGETWTNTQSDGSSPVCFGMAVKCGYLKQVQAMAEERPELLEIVNTSTGHTPLATAVKKGDMSTVRLLLSLGAEVNQQSLARQTSLQLAVLAGDVPLVELLLERGADPEARDCNGLRVEHYAVDSGSREMLCFILDRGGDLQVTDNNGWTPLFRALVQGARTCIVEELVSRGSDVSVVDCAGLPLMSAAKLLTNRHGRPRDSVLKLVDAQYPREKALAHFTRVSRKIHHLHTLFNIH